MKAGPLVLLAAAVAWLAAAAPEANAQAGFNSNFDHFTAGFRLEGAHLTTDCESCHVDGVFDGTPTDCASCHALAGRIRATAKPATHVLSADFCEDCHRQGEWFPLARMDHDAVYGSCSACHNNVQSAGKPPDHPVTQLDCEACHDTSRWLPARFDHAIVTGNCVGCHNGVDATGKHAAHFAATNVCEDCHTTVAFAPASVDHLQVQGTCSSCHNGTTATGMHAGHVQTNAECEACHTTLAWLPAGFDHSNVTPGTCSGCHNGTTATGKDAGHFTTQLECDHCHSDEFFTPLVFAHVSAGYPGDHRVPLGCTDCHSTNAELVAWPFPAYAPDCAGCHAGDFRAGPHEGATVSELRDCAGSCHQSSPEHSVNAREW